MAMKLSPFQVLEAFTERVFIEQYPGEVEEEVGFEQIADNLFFFRAVEAGAAYWADEEGIPDVVRDRTFTVRLGVKGDKDTAPVVGYQFEVVIALHIVVAASVKASESVSLEDFAARAGLARAYGLAIECLATNTTRMKHGVLRLPALNFSDVTYNEVRPSTTTQVSLPLDEADEVKPADK